MTDAVDPEVIVTLLAEYIETALLALEIDVKPVPVLLMLMLPPDVVRSNPAPEFI